MFNKIPSRELWLELEERLEGKHLNVFGKVDRHALNLYKELIDRADYALECNNITPAEHKQVVDTLNYVKMFI